MTDNPDTQPMVTEARDIDAAIDITGAQWVLQSKAQAATDCLADANYKPTRSHVVGCRNAMHEALEYLNDAQKTLARHRTQQTARSADVGRVAVNRILGEVLGAVVPDVAERIRVGDKVCDEILAALTTPPADERPCRHCEGADPHCSVCEGVGSLPNTVEPTDEPVQKVHELPDDEPLQDGGLREWPPALTQSLREILGIPNFQCGPMARAYQKIDEFSGAESLALDKRAEDEQAFILHKLLGFWFKHGDAWREPAIDEIDRAAKLARQALSRGK